MRDINRIDGILTAVGEAWKKVPDWRFMQLICNLQKMCGQDMFYFEDDRFVQVLHKCLDSILGGKE